MDQIRIRWANAYSGRTDNGFTLPIKRVVPGIIVQGQPIGYMPAESEEQVEEAWRYKWVNLG